MKARPAALPPRRRLELKSVVAVDAVAAEAGPDGTFVGPALAGDGSAIVTNSIAIVASPATRAVEDHNPLRIYVIICLSIPCLAVRAVPIPGLRPFATTVPEDIGS